MALVTTGQLPNNTEYVSPDGSAVATWHDETSPGADGGPVWSSKCTCGDPDDGEMYCWEIGTAVSDFHERALPNCCPNLQQLPSPPPACSAGRGRATSRAGLCDLHHARN